MDDWETIRSSAYVFPGEDLTKTGRSADEYNTNGFEIGPHINTLCANYTSETLRAFFTDELGQFSALYPDLPPLASQRLHCIPWGDYTTLPEVEFDFGIRLDLNYYYYPGSWVADRPGLFTGSGMPMRFATTNGQVIDVYQAATQMTDESGQSYPYTIDTLLDRALGPEGYYGAFVANMHTDADRLHPSSVWSSNIVNSAKARGVPVISARQMLTWLDARNGSSIGSIVQTGDTETFSINARADARGLQAMVPVPSGKVVSEVLRGVTPITNSVRWVKGVLYAMFPASTGNYTITYAADTTPPTVTSVSPTNGAVGVSVSTAVVVMFSKPMDPMSINTNSISVRGPGGALVPATVVYNPSALEVTAVLTPHSPLNPATTYTVVVTNGVTGVRDVGGVELADVFSASFSTVDQAEFSLWGEFTGTADGGDPSSVEVGMKFQSALSGYITGIRFYKSAANTGTHVGNLWGTNGTPLARVTFVNEAGSGWQYQALTNPVAIAANTTYVVSYYAPVGRYAYTAGAFTSGVTNYPLRALSSGEGGGNGVFKYNAASIFPTDSGNGANYWVDVVFTTGFGPDTNGPTVIGVSPVNGAAGVSPATRVRVTFSEAMDPLTHHQRDHPDEFGGSAGAERGGLLRCHQYGGADAQ